MPQAAPLTSPRLPILLVALAFTLFAWPSSATEIESVYTKLDLDQCKDVTPEEIKDNGAVLICPGYGGIDVRVAEGDLRIFVSYGPNAADQTAAYETLPQFNSIGETLEWRVRQGGRQAQAVRHHPPLQVGRRRQEGLDAVVTKLGTDDACHMAYVEATNNPQANEAARAIADKEAASFVCKQDKAKTY